MAKAKRPYPLVAEVIPPTARPPRVGVADTGPRSDPERPKGGPPGNEPPKEPPGDGGPPASATLEETVQHVNAVYLRSALDAALDAATFVHQRFLGGDLKRLGKGPDDLSLAALAAHPDLRVSPAFLWTAFAVYLQFPSLPEETVWRLPLSHHRLLLGVPDKRSKNALARRAVREALSKRELDIVVEEWRAGRDLPPIGRPPEDPAVRAARRLASAALALLRALDRKPRPRASQGELADLVRLADGRLQKVKKSLAGMPSDA